MKKAKMFVIGPTLFAIIGATITAHHKCLGDLLICDTATNTCVASFYNDEYVGQPVQNPPVIFKGIIGAACSSVPTAPCHQALVGSVFACE